MTALHLNRAALVESIDRAFDFAAASAANANQHGLFDMGGEDDHGSSTQEPDLVEVLPWGVREQLTQEKSAVGFYLSGHLFDEMALEVRRFAKRPIEEVLETREPQVLAGIISGFKVINGNRGKVGIFTLDDKSAAIEATADEALLTTYRSLLQDDDPGDCEWPFAARAQRLCCAFCGAAGLEPGASALPLWQIFACGRATRRPAACARFAGFAARVSGRA